MSELTRLMSILHKVYERPEAREEFRIELYKLYEKDPALYEQTMVDLEKLEPTLNRETRDFLYNINEVKEFLKSVEQHKTASD